VENSLQTGRKAGMIVRDNRLDDLSCKCWITYDGALSRARHPDRDARDKG